MGWGYKYVWHLCQLIPVLTHLNTYNKKERLKSRKQLDALFKSGKTLTVFPVKMFYALVEGQDNPVKAGVGVSKKFFKKAVERNRIKRLLREAYRTEKQPLQLQLSNGKKQLNLFLLFIDKELPSYDLVKDKIRLCIKRLINELHEVDIKNT
jgi:ribonuclease P protein component